VMAKVMPQFGHNYNFVSREVMYHFFNKHLSLGVSEPIIEEDYQRLSLPEMTVWDDAHPKPQGGGDYERSLLRFMTEESERQIAALTPSDSASLARFRDIVGGGVDVLIGRGLSSAAELEFEGLAEEPGAEYTQAGGLLRNKPREEELPLVILHPKNWNKRIVLWIHEAGKAGLYGVDGKPTPEVAALLKAGLAVAGADLLYQGEFLADGKPLAEGRRVNNSREFAGYTFAYNPSLLAQRVHDILTVVSFLRNYGDAQPQIDLLGSGAAGAWVAAARAQASGAVGRAAIDTDGFRFAKLRLPWDVNFLPGGAKYGDLPGMLALAAGGDLWLGGEGPMPPGLVSAAYTAAGASAKLHLFPGPQAERIAAAVKWLSQP